MSAGKPDAMTREIQQAVAEAPVALEAALKDARKLNVLARPPGHCDSEEAWEHFSTNPRYASTTRDSLAMSELSDFELANAQYLVDRRDLMLGAYQTAAKERIRWLSVQLAAALARIGGAP